jgi:CheY-like chemotaxis protein
VVLVLFIMKVFIAKTSPYINVVLQTFRNLQNPWEVVEVMDESETILLIDNYDKLHSLYQEYGDRKVFAYFTTRDEPKKALPWNVIHFDATLHIDNVAKKMETLAEAVQKMSVRPAEVSSSILALPNSVKETIGSYDVLVIDDRAENLGFAEKLLGTKHRVKCACGFEAGMMELEHGSFDVVLSDMKMPDNRYYPSYSMSYATVGTTDNWGFAVMLEATAKGLPVAIVTDGNYHADWVVAMFSRVKSAEINSQKVLFFRDIGKRWDIALAALEEIGAFDQAPARV